jgi:hypothetical protein
MYLTNAHGRGSTFRGASQVGAGGDQDGELATLIAACVWVPTVGADYIDDVDVVRAGGMKALLKALGPTVSDHSLLQLPTRPFVALAGFEGTYARDHLHQRMDAAASETGRLFRQLEGLSRRLSDGDVLPSRSRKCTTATTSSKS